MDWIRLVIYHLLSSQLAAYDVLPAGHTSLTILLDYHESSPSASLTELEDILNFEVSKYSLFVTGSTSLESMRRRLVLLLSTGCRLFSIGALDHP